MTSYKEDDMIKLTLSIGVANAVKSDEMSLFSLTGLVEHSLADMSDGEVEIKIYEGWREWIWEHIDGAAKKAN